MTESFLLYNRGRFYNVRFIFTFLSFMMKLLTTKKTDRHRRVPPIMGGTAGL